MKIARKLCQVELSVRSRRQILQIFVIYIEAWLAATLKDKIFHLAQQAHAAELLSISAIVWLVRILGSHPSTQARVLVADFFKVSTSKIMEAQIIRHTYDRSMSHRVRIICSLPDHHKVPRGFEPRSLDSESRVLTVTPRDQLILSLFCST